MAKSKSSRIVRKNGSIKKLRSRNVVVGLFFVVGVLVLVLAGLVLSVFGVFENNDPQMFNVKDECSLVMGNLIHQIRDDGECRIKCVNECDVRDMEFVSFSFAGKNDDCNSCECWCS